MALSKQRASNRALRILILWLRANGYEIKESLPYDRVDPVHAKGSWHYDSYFLGNVRYSKAVDINWPGGGALEKRMLKRAYPVARGLGLGFIHDITGRGRGSAGSHCNHAHSDPGSWSNIGDGAFTPPRGTTKVYDLQVITHTPAKKRDNLLGPDGHKRMEAIRMASRLKGPRFPWGVRYTQAVLGVPQTGSWDVASRKGHDEAVMKIQRVLGLEPTGIWDSKTDAAYVAFSREWRTF